MAVMATKQKRKKRRKFQKEKKLRCVYVDGHVEIEATDCWPLKKRLLANESESVWRYVVMMMAATYKEKNLMYVREHG